MISPLACLPLHIYDTLSLLCSQIPLCVFYVCLLLLICIVVFPSVLRIPCLLLVSSAESMPLRERDMRYINHTFIIIVTHNSLCLSRFESFISVLPVAHSQLIFRLALIIRFHPLSCCMPGGHLTLSGHLPCLTLSRVCKHETSRRILSMSVTCPR